MNEQKAIIIGSGLGGLSCAVLLAQNGYQVTVLEQGNQVGGCLQCFTRGGVKFETGMHFIGSAAEGQVLHRLLQSLEVAGQIKLSPLDPQGYDVISLRGRHYRFAQGRRAFVDTLSADFPHEREHLEQLCNLIDEVARASSFHSLEHTETDDAVNTRYQMLSINEVINSVITDPELRHVLAGNLPLYAAERDRTPFSLYAFIMNFYNQSAYRIVGGSDQLVKAFCTVIRKYGGEVLTRHQAVEMVCNDTRATAVRCADGTLFEADVVVSAIHPARTIELTTSPLLRPAYRRRIANLRNTVGCFAVYLRFKPESEPYMNHNFYGYRQDTPWGCEDYDETSWPKGWLYMHFCEAEHMAWARSGVILSYMKMSDVAQWLGTTVSHRGEDYERFKHAHAERLLDAVEEEFPQLRHHIAAYYTSTPLTYRDYTGTEDGSMYGVAKDIAVGPAGRVHHRTKIPNLLLAGQNVNSHGILGTLVGSFVACGELRKNNLSAQGDCELK